MVADAPVMGERKRGVPSSSTTAAITYSGRWTQDSYDRHCATLLAALARESLTPVGEPRFARYNPPFTPWFLRRNEVLVDVTDVPTAAAGQE